MGGTSLFQCSLSKRRLTPPLPDGGGLSRQTVNINGDTTIHFWSPPAPTSKPKVLLIHGFGPPSKWQWRQQAVFFSGEYDVYLPDLVFFGESFTTFPTVPRFSKLSALVDYWKTLELLRDELRWLCSNRTASMWPERVEKVVIANSAENTGEPGVREAEVD